MNVLALSPYPERLGLDGIHVADPERCVLGQAEACRADYLVVYGWRKLLRGALLSRYPGRIINIHISYLPYNRGADPNFWSWFDDTPKGVSVHEIDEGVDTGPVLAREAAAFKDEAPTLASTYADLQAQAEALFRRIWPELLAGRITPEPQPSPGPRPRRSAEKTPWFEQLSAGWNTPTAEVAALGRAARRAKGPLT